MSGCNDNHVSTIAHTRMDTEPDTPYMADTFTNVGKPSPVALKLASHEKHYSTNTTLDGDTRVDSAISPEDCYSETAIDEKQWHRSSAHQHESRHSMTGRHHDVEKGPFATPRSSNHTLTHLNPADLRPRAEPEDFEQIQSAKSVRILLYLAGPCVAVSFMNLLFTLIALLITLLYQPLRLCTPRLSSSEQIRHLLTPTLNLHLRGIYCRLFPLPSEETRCSALWLIIVHVMAPFLSVPLAIASWIVAVYWCLASVVGDPSGTDKRDDGIEAVLALRRWWEDFLLHAIKL